MDQAAMGLLLLVMAGAMNGSFTLPMKFTKNWAWENTWLAWTIFALGIFPPVLAMATLPPLREIYSTSGMGPVMMVAAFGAGWGISQVFFGLAVEALGIALAFSYILGLAAALGSLIPLIQAHSDKIFTPSGLMVLGGLALLLIGVGVCAVAGRRRAYALGQTAAAAGPRTSVALGLVFATISGVGSALVGLGLEYGKSVQQAAAAHGAAQVWTPMAVWLPLMWAGGIPNLIYTIYLLRKNKTANKFSTPGTAWYWFLAAIMALFWFGSTVMYGASTTKFGELGTVLAWPMFMSLIVITASVWGVVTGEWKGAGKGPLRIQTIGVVVLIGAVFLLGFASRSL